MCSEPSVIRERHGGGCGRTIDRLLITTAGGLRVTRAAVAHPAADQLLAPDRIVGTTTLPMWVAECRARLERDLEEQVVPGSSRAWAHLFLRDRGRSCSGRRRDDCPMTSSPLPVLVYGDALRWLRPARFRRIEVHLGPLDPGLGDAEPADALLKLSATSMAPESASMLSPRGRRLRRIAGPASPLSPVAANAAQGRDGLVGDVHSPHAWSGSRRT